MSRTGLPKGGFDLPHLCSIHRHLFQDLYDWAGQTRTVELTKGTDDFMPWRLIGRGMDDVYWRLADSGFLRALAAEEFSQAAGRIMGDLNHIHPFREGNGRTQLQYLSQLADQAGHLVDLGQLDKARWLDASRASHLGDHALMAREIARITVAPRPALDLAIDQGIDL